MSIINLKVSNFKSIDNLDLSLEDFNVIIGTNASGKSNFVQIFKFISNIALFGLDNAISMQGGLNYLININKDSPVVFSLDITSKPDRSFKITTSKKNKFIGTKINEVNYKFALKVNKEKNEYKIIKDNLNLKCNFFELRHRMETEKIMNRLTKPFKIMGNLKEVQKISSGEINISKSGKKTLIKVDGPIEGADVIPDYLIRLMSDDSIKDELLIETPISFIPVRWKNIFSTISTFDFDPKLCKRATLITGKSDLEENGENLSIVLKKIIDNKEDREKFLNLLEELMPFISDLEVDSFVDRSIIFKLKEKYSDEYLSASFISDGTINLITLIIALYFEKNMTNNLTIIEEPERNMHPSLISGMVDMMKDASTEKQIIITTHNPELLKKIGLKNLFLISRDKEGYSKIIKPDEKEEIKLFLKNEIGIEELFIQNLLGF